jgi:hypothetical protein
MAAPRGLLGDYRAMDARAEQLVLDYLRRLGEASRHVLSPQERSTFLARSRTAIAGQIGEAQAAAPADVQRLLERLGDPRVLAARERQRLDVSASAAQRPIGLADLLSPAPPRPPVPAEPRGPGEDGIPAGYPPDTRAGPGEARHRPDARAGPGEARYRPDTPPGPAMGITRARLRSVLALIRRHPLETVAVLLLGGGGLIYPFPLWLIAMAAVIASRGWDARDKWAAVAIPVAFTLIAAIAIAGIFARSGSLAGYVSTVRIDGWDLIRAGSVVAAAYLVWRLRRGRRPPREPPWRRPPRA